MYRRDVSRLKNKHNKFGNKHHSLPNMLYFYYNPHLRVRGLSSHKIFINYALGYIAWLTKNFQLSHVP